MSDFLTNLASRSVNRVPVVQPRLASRFEAQAAINKLNPRSFERAPLDQVNSELVELETADLSDTGVSVLGDRESAMATQPTQPRPGEFNPPTDGMLQQSQNTAQSNRMIAAQPIANNAIESNAIQQRSPETATLIEPSIVRPQPLLPFSALSNPSLQSAVQPLRSSTAPRSQEASPNDDSLLARQSIIPQNLPPAASPIEASIRVQPQITPHLESLREELPAASPPPTIHVTIGRIEVRAHTAAAPAKPAPRSPAPALTLDRYLNQRSGGQT
jgi:hypothetical protein